MTDGLVGETRSIRSLLTPPAWTIALAGAWVALGLANEGTTYHLAPLLVAAAWPVLSRSANGGRVPLRSAVLVTAASLAVVITAAAVLSADAALTGPSLLPWGDARAETVVFAAAGSAYGLRVASRERSPWYLRR